MKLGISFGSLDGSSAVDIQQASHRKSRERRDNGSRVNVEVARWSHGLEQWARTTAVECSIGDSANTRALNLKRISWESAIRLKAMKRLIVYITIEHKTYKFEQSAVIGT